jgi:hypothetical protein
MYNLFILGYNAAWFQDKYLDASKFPNTNFRIIDNGQQAYSDKLKPLVYYTTTKNISCSGGWNLICKIGFEYLGLDKIIISNEDNLYSEEYLEALYNQCTPTNIAGTYDKAFEFSLFCIHRDTYNKIGKFDENFLRGCCEDEDYKYRCKMQGITVSCLGIPSHFNYNLAAGDRIPEYQKRNLQYLKEKWGNFTYTNPFNNLLVDSQLRYYPCHNIYTYMTYKNMIQEFGTIYEWPSVTEYKNFTNLKNNIYQ